MDEIEERLLANDVVIMAALGALLAPQAKDPRVEEFCRRLGDAIEKTKRVRR